MASTTKTTNLELSQFVGTDKPAWLTDYNGDMQKIDNGYKKLEDANTATQADLDATKQNLDGSKSDINDVKANVQALEAQDIALGNRLTVVEGNYDTMHHEIAINTQKIADMEPYAMITSNKKHRSNVTSSIDEVNHCVLDNKKTSMIDIVNDVRISRFLFGSRKTSDSGVEMTDFTSQLLDKSGNVESTATITFPSNGFGVASPSNRKVVFTIGLGGNEYLHVTVDADNGIVFSHQASNGTTTPLMNIAKS